MPTKKKVPPCNVYDKRFRLMKGHSYSEKRIIYPAVVQPKLNGVRAGYYQARFNSYDRKIWKNSVMAHLWGPLQWAFKAMNLETFMIQGIDGEFYKHGWSLQKIQRAVAVKRVAPGPLTPKIEYHIFDCMIAHRGFTARYKRMQQVIKFLHEAGATQFKLVPARMVFNKEEADALYDQWTKAGYEGMMYRLPTRHLRKAQEVEPEWGYFPSRSWHLLKRKDFKDAEFKIVSIMPGRDTDKGGKYKNCMGALVCITKEGHKFNVGSGFSDKQRIKFWKNPPIGKRLKVKFLNYSDDGIPLNPTSLGLRESWH